MNSLAKKMADNIKNRRYSDREDALSDVRLAEQSGLISAANSISIRCLIEDYYPITARN